MLRMTTMSDKSETGTAWKSLKVTMFWLQLYGDLGMTKNNKGSKRLTLTLMGKRINVTTGFRLYTVPQICISAIKHQSCKAGVNKFCCLRNSTMFRYFSLVYGLWSNDKQKRSKDSRKRTFLLIGHQAILVLEKHRFAHRP